MIRGLHAHQGILHGVAGQSLFRMDSEGSRTVLGTLNSTGGPLDFSSTISQLVISDGSYLYVWDGATLRALNEAQGYVPGDRIGMLDQRVAGIQRSSQRFAWSALGDAGSWGALDFASAEAVPDNLVSMAVVYGELLLLGEFSGEIWQSVGGETIFQRNGSAYLEWGCAAAFSLRKCGPSAIWLGRNEHGQAAVLQLQGYQATPVSTRAIEERFEGRDLSGASAFVMLDGKQEFYCLNVPGIDTTLVYSTLTKRWHERAELVAGNWQPWRATCHAFAYGQHYVGAADGNIYRLDRDAHDYAGAPKVRSRIVPVISKPDRGRVIYGPLEVVCAKATGGQLLVRWSNDNGSTWSDWETVGAGLVGEHWQRVRLNRLGSGYDRVLELRMADAAPFDPVDAWLEAA